jgi:hypothetical protein
MTRILSILSLLFLFSVAAPAAETKAVFCTQDAKLCPDGSGVGRTGPNCEFAPCPGEKTPGKKEKGAGKHRPACAKDLKICPDGSAVGRTGANCEFALCLDETVPGEAPRDESGDEEE